MSKYEVFSGLYFPVFGLNTEIYGDLFSPNTGKYGPEKHPYLDTFHAVIFFTRTPHNSSCSVNLCYYWDISPDQN